MDCESCNYDIYNRGVEQWLNDNFYNSSGNGDNCNNYRTHVDNDYPTVRLVNLCAKKYRSGVLSKYSGRKLAINRNQTNVDHFHWLRCATDWSCTATQKILENLIL
jgi:hypothetical protein